MNTEKQAAGARAAPGSEPWWRGELAVRMASAAVLAPLGLGAIAAGGWLFFAALALALAAMAYEWHRMARARHPVRLAVMTTLMGLAAISGQAQAWGLIAPTLIVLAIWAQAGRRAYAAVGGALYLVGPVLAFFLLRLDFGVASALGVLIVVIATDSAAYLCGRAWGGARVFPELFGANKSYAGLAGGVLFGAAAGALLACVHGAGPAVGAGAGAGLAVAGLSGDLFESFVKRRFGVKDSSGFIPGHGGVLDRFDGLMFAAVLSFISLTLSPGLRGALHL